MLQHQQVAGNAYVEPTVTSGSGYTVPSDNTTLLSCAEVAVDRYQSVQRCSMTELSFNSSLVGDAGSTQVFSTYQNPAPAACSAAAADTTRIFFIAPRPVITSLPFPFVCAGRDIMLRVNGSGFIRADGEQPDVTFENMAVNASLVKFPTNCTNVAHDNPPHTVDTCNDFDLTLSVSAFTDSSFNRTEQIALTLPFQNRTWPPCATTYSVGVLRPMNLSAVIPTNGQCANDPVLSVTLIGEFWELDGQVPTVRRNNTVESTVGVVAASCGAATTVLGRSIRSCGALTVTSSSAMSGSQQWSVSHPLLSCGLTNVQITTVSYPVMQIDAVLPRGGCALPNIVAAGLQGVFWIFDNVLPIITVDGTSTSEYLETCDAEVVYTSPSNPSWSYRTQRCTVLFVNNTGVADLIGAHTWAGSNGLCELPAVAVTTTDRQFPFITNLNQTEFCFDQLSQMVITGGNFFDSDLRVFLYDSANLTLPLREITVLSHTNTTAIVQWAAFSIEPSTYNVRVMNKVGCQANSTQMLTIRPLVIPFAVLPKTVSNRLALSATILVAGLGEKPALVEFIHSAGAATGYYQYVPANITQPDVGNVNEFQVVLPVNMVAGNYTLKVTSIHGCFQQGQDLLLVTSDNSVTISSWSITHAKNGTVVSGIALSATDGFVGPTPPPLMIMNPQSGGDAIIAVGVTFENAGRLAASFQNVQVGVYDLIVVNSDATVGTFTAALTVLSTDPVQITNVEPVAIPDGFSMPVVLFGVGFSTTVASNSVVFNCAFPDGTEVFTGLTTTTASTATSVTVTLISPSGLVPGQVCLVQISNTEQGTSFTFSAVTAISAATTAKLDSSEYIAANAPSISRRGAAAVAVSPTPTQKLLYVMGGETGTGTTHTGVLNSVERVQLDDIGTISRSWSSVGRQGTLPMNVSFAAAETVGQYIYLMGGHNGTTSQSAVYRALVLSPLQVPRISLQFSVDVNQPGLGSIASGLWSYRVSAVFGSSDTVNPSGEALSSSVFSIQVPTPPSLPVNTTVQLAAVLSWTPVPNAVAYNVYRTTMQDAALSTLRLHVVVSTNTYTDRGQASTGTSNPSITPLNIGDIGNWATVGPLATARWGLSAVAAQQGNQYAAPPATVHILAIGGKTDSAVSGAVDRIQISRTMSSNFVNPEQQVSPLVGADTALPAGRYVASVVLGNPEVLSTYTSNQKKAMLFGGLDASETIGTIIYETSVSFFTVPTTWLSGTRTTGTDTQGHCARLLQNQFFQFVGSPQDTFGTGTASTTALTTRLCAVADVNCNQAPTSTGNPWDRQMPVTSSETSTTNSLKSCTARNYAACVSANGNLYLINGQDSTIKTNVAHWPM
jgi:hypothetical protein